MLALFFKCPACHESPTDRSSLPLCGPCRESLVSAPALCARCAGFECEPGQCLRPWISHSGIDSFSARYVCVEPGYRVLKRWKTTQAASGLDAKILAPDPALFERLGKLGLDAVTWVPQRRERSWNLGGSPAERIARWIAQSCDRPTIAALLPTSISGPRQAELRMQDRLAHRLRFRWNEETPQLNGENILLVDDFMTTGRTLKAAAQILRSRGAFGVHVFCLGIRPVLRRLGHLVL